MDKGDMAQDITMGERRGSHPSVDSHQPHSHSFPPPQPLHPSSATYASPYARPPNHPSYQHHHPPPSSYDPYPPPSSSSWPPPPATSGYPSHPTPAYAYPQPPPQSHSYNPPHQSQYSHYPPPPPPQQQQDAYQHPSYSSYHSPSIYPAHPPPPQSTQSLPPPSALLSHSAAPQPFIASPSMVTSYPPSQIGYPFPSQQQQQPNDGGYGSYQSQPTSSTQYTPSTSTSAPVPAPVPQEPQQQQAAPQPLQQSPTVKQHQQPQPQPQPQEPKRTIETAPPTSVVSMTPASSDLSGQAAKVEPSVATSQPSQPPKSFDLPPKTTRNTKNKEEPHHSEEEGHIPEAQILKNELLKEKRKGSVSSSSSSSRDGTPTPSSNVGTPTGSGSTRKSKAAKVSSSSVTVPAKRSAEEMLDKQQQQQTLKGQFPLPRRPSNSSLDSQRPSSSSSASKPPSGPTSKTLSNGRLAPSSLSLGSKALNSGSDSITPSASTPASSTSSGAPTPSTKTTLEPVSKSNGAVVKQKPPSLRSRSMANVEDLFPGMTLGAQNLKGKLKALIDSNPDVLKALNELQSDPATNNKRQKTDTTSEDAPLLFTPTSTPAQWSFKLTLPSNPLNPTSSPPQQVQLTTCAIIHRSGYPSFLLEKDYKIQSMLPRSYFNLLQQRNIPHAFVFEVSEQEHAFFKEMVGLRRTSYFLVKEAGGSGEEWELHLKHSRERTNLFGYLVKASDMNTFIQQHVEMLMGLRRLPLVLDLDDTLVRVVGDEEGRYVKESDAVLVPHRVRKLPDGRRIVLTERVEEFLDFASRFYEISVCSVGDPSYVDQVVQVLDPTRTRIRGFTYSARSEFLHIQSSTVKNRPPKDLGSLYAFYFRDNKLLTPLQAWETSSTSFQRQQVLMDPLVVDDNVGMWPVEQQDNIIVVREARGAAVWNVQLFPVVQNVLMMVHDQFFKQVDAIGAGGGDGGAGGVLSAGRLYKEFLRAEISRRIAEPVSNGLGGGLGERNGSSSSSSNALGEEKGKEAVERKKVKELGVMESPTTLGMTTAVMPAMLAAAVADASGMK
ncbi:RNA polymerase II [Chytridiales sp. JEL 0842]|nr:RNA polymerase II [Chytridiales sp. JEL 0842]